jgi:hypothetical protein
LETGRLRAPAARQALTTSRSGRKRWTSWVLGVSRTLRTGSSAASQSDRRNSIRTSPALLSASAREIELANALPDAPPRRVQSAFANSGSHPITIYRRRTARSPRFAGKFSAPTGRGESPVTTGRRRGGLCGPTEMAPLAALTSPCRRLPSRFAWRTTTRGRRRAELVCDRDIAGLLTRLPRRSRLGGMLRSRGS